MANKELNALENIHEKMIRHFLRRKIAVINKKINNKLFANKRGRNISYSDIVGGFANPFPYGSKYTEELNEIYAHIKKHKNGFSPYNYFDIPTLNAYLKYVFKLNKEIESNKIGADRGYYTEGDFRTALCDTCEWLRNNAGTEETGFYSVKQPIKILKFNGKISPGRTLPEEEFDEKYDERVCQKLLNEYLYEMFKKKEDYDFYYNKEGYFVDSVVDQYVSEDGTGVQYIKASNSVNELRGYFYEKYQPFHGGDLYDDKKNLVILEDETSVDVYSRYPGKQRKKDDGMGR